MDWMKVSELLVAFFVPLSPYLVKFGEGIATEFGKRTANKIIQVGTDSWQALRKILPGFSPENLRIIIDEPENISRTKVDLAKQLEESVKRDSQNIEIVDEIMIKVRGAIYDLIVDGFLSQDLQELYLRMGVGFDELVASANPGLRSLVFSLVDYSSKRDRGMIKLVSSVERVRPDLLPEIKQLNEQSGSTPNWEKLGVFLADKLTNNDLNEVYFRLGVGIDELVRRAKARAIIEYAETRTRLPELVQNMWLVNPSAKEP